MKIAEVNNCDLIGRRFNGHGLQLSLNARGHEACQLVLQKDGTEPTTIPLCGSTASFLRRSMIELELQLSVTNLLFPFGRALEEHPLFQSADLVHYHLIHNNLLSILDFPRLSSLVPSVWTVHDPWIVTGHCVHPLACEKWKSGCVDCPNLEDKALPMKIDKASQMWQIKKQVYREMDIDLIVATQFTKDYITNSPLTAHFKRIHTIPFGIKTEDFRRCDKKKARDRWEIPNDHFVIAFRAESNKIKGLQYIIEMLDSLTAIHPVTLLTVGFGALPEGIGEKYNVVPLGWQNDPELLLDFYAACDVFIMPSLAETFGLMAIEAMAAGRPVIVFEKTVLPETTFAPECGIAVPYRSGEGIRAAVERLMKNPEEGRQRGDKGRALAEEHYRYEDYVNRHIACYQEILSRKGIRC